MVQINLHGRTVRSFDIPENWNELNERQLVHITQTLHKETEKQKADVHLVRALLQVSKWRFKHLGSNKPGKVKSAEIVTQLLPQVQWVYNNEIYPTNQAIPVVKIKGKKYCGPDSALSNLTFAEFSITEREEYECQNGNDVEALYRLVACMYRPAKKKYDVLNNPEGDIRETFNYNSVMHRAEIFQKHLPISYAMAILLWYKGCRRYITELYWMIFTGDAGSEDENNNDGPQYFGIMRMIAKAGTYGTFADVGNMWLYNALNEMKASIEEAERIKEANK